jgi:hypothetical protein
LYVLIQSAVVRDVKGGTSSTYTLATIKNWVQPAVAFNQHSNFSPVVMPLLSF